MFWVVAGDPTDRVSPPQIERATMDGNSRRSIITTDLGQPRSVTIDNQLGVGARIYWTDSGKGTIECSNYDGTGRIVIIGVCVCVCACVWVWVCALVPYN